MRKRIKDGKESAIPEENFNKDSADEKHKDNKIKSKAAAAAEVQPTVEMQQVRPEREFAWSSFFGVMAAMIIFSAATIGYNSYELKRLVGEHFKEWMEQKVAEQQAAGTSTAVCDVRPVVQIWSPRVDLMHLSHVTKVFDHFGFRQANAPNDTEWDVLWAHDYPFHEWRETLKTLKPHQKVNHFPGTGYVTTKVSLATTGGPFIPPAFKIPEHKDKLMEYASSHPDSLFVEKKNDHRQVRLKELQDLDFNASDSFVQEFMANPLLINGHKFDIGVYTIITSIDPLRIYKFDGDVLFRFCMEAYEPFNGSNTEQYVIGEDYIPAWNIPALQKYTELAFSRKAAFDAYIRSCGKDPQYIWNQIDEAISSVYLTKEKLFADLIARYKSKRSFFEMVRFDFIIDENLKIYLLEANMSPNLSSLHYIPNGLMYEQVLHSLLALVDIASYLHPPHPLSKSAEDMIASDHSLMVFPEICVTCEDCQIMECQLCNPCMLKSTKEDLKMAFKEHLNRQRCKRIYPPPMSQEESHLGLTLQQKELSNKNQLMLLWFQGKCIEDASWCI